MVEQVLMLQDALTSALMERDELLKKLAELEAKQQESERAQADQARQIERLKGQVRPLLPPRSN
jgi:hypothetical protein